MRIRPEIGVERLNQEDINQAKKDLEERPPVPPDLSRVLNVITSEFQFVEIKFKGSKIENCTFSLSARDMGVKRRRLAERVSGSYKIIEGESIPQLDGLKEKLERIKRSYLKTVKRYGPIIEWKDKSAFTKAMTNLMNEIDAVKKKVHESLTLRLEKSKVDLQPMIISNLKKLPKPDLAHLVFPEGYSEAALEQFATNHIMKDFPTAEELIEEIECRHEFRNISREHLEDKEFRKYVEETLGRSIDQVASQRTAVPIKDIPSSV